MLFLPIRVLVIDENPFKRLIAADAFRNLGCEEISVAADSLTALNILKSTDSVDVAWCGLKIDSAEGLNKLEMLSRCHSFKYVIICGTFSKGLQHALIQTISAHGVKTWFLNKPTSTRQIGVVLEEILEALTTSRVKASDSLHLK